MKNTCFIYVPEYCKTATDCNVHFNFLGCNKFLDSTIRDSLNSFAANNKVIAIYTDLACWSGGGGNIVDAAKWTKDGILPKALM